MEETLLKSNCELFQVFCNFPSKLRKRLRKFSMRFARRYIEIFEF